VAAAVCWRSGRRYGRCPVRAWSTIVAGAGQLPAGVWITLAGINLVVTLLTWSVAGRRMRRAGQRAADSRLVAGSGRSRDTALTVAAMIPAGLFWAMVLAGSLHGLVAFGRGVLGWHGGWEYLVPGTLDGVSVTFAFLAFRAVRMKKVPDRCYRVVWGAAVASATVNFAYEYAHSGHNVIAGGYLALLSLFGMLMLHEFLAQFEEGAAYVKRANPKFGLRWITWPANTFCAAVAWRNYPPTEGTEVTVLNAVANLDRVRVLKQVAREGKVADRHQQAVATARRREELRAVTAGASVAGGPAADGGGVTGTPGVPQLRPNRPVAPAHALRPSPVNPLAARARSVVLKPRREAADEGRARGVRVPSKAATVAEWVSLWVRLCADGDFLQGALNEDDARARYGVTAKQLRNVRRAATSGALRQKATMLGVALPPGYLDRSADGQVDGHDMAGAVT
jgi:hypothetical protein